MPFDKYGFTAEEQVMLIQHLEKSTQSDGGPSERGEEISKMLIEHRNKCSQDQKFVDWPTPIRCHQKIQRLCRPPYCSRKTTIRNFCRNGPSFYNFQFRPITKDILASTISTTQPKVGETEKPIRAGQNLKDSDYSTAQNLTIVSPGHPTFQQQRFPVTKDLISNTVGIHTGDDISPNDHNLLLHDVSSMLNSGGVQQQLIASTLRFSKTLDNIEREINSSRLVESDISSQMQTIEQRVNGALAQFMDAVNFSTLHFERLSDTGKDLGTTLLPSPTDQAPFALDVCQATSQVRVLDILVGFFNASLFRWVYQSFPEDNHGLFQKKVGEILQCTGDSGDYVRNVLEKKLLHSHLMQLRNDTSELRRKSTGHAIELINILKQVCVTQPVNIDDFQQRVQARISLENALTDAYIIGYSMRIELALNTCNQYRFYLPKACQKFNPAEMANPRLRPDDQISLCKLFGIKVTSSEDGAIERVLHPATVI